AITLIIPTCQLESNRQQSKFEWLMPVYASAGMGADRMSPAMILGLVDILKMAGFDERKTTKLVRHQSQYDSIEELRRNDWLEVYQAYQKKSVFHKAKQIISFYGLPNNRAGFYGVYEVQGYLPVDQGALLVGCPTVERWRNTCEFFYVLKHDERF